MNDNDQITILQSLLDHYRTKYYQAEYDNAVLQLQAKATISRLEQQVREFSSGTAESGNIESAE
jgi:hypothetical protein